jgi:uncharacterized Fe-S cluster-containing MiaB family protein
VYSVIVPVPSVAVVVVVVVRSCGTSWVFMSGCRMVCPHVNDATAAKAMLKSIFFIISSLLVELRR